jgi:hypothetical protein
MADDPARMEDHQLLVRIDERQRALEQRMADGFRHVSDKFAEVQERVELARDVYPTQKDVAIALEAARSDAKLAAVEAAKQLAEKLEITAQASDKRIAALELAQSSTSGARAGTVDFRTVMLSLAVLAVGVVSVVVAVIR